MNPFVRFMDPDGQHVWIAARYVTKIRAPIPGRYGPNTHAVIYMGNVEQAVREGAELVVKLLEEACNATHGQG